MAFSIELLLYRSDPGGCGVDHHQPCAGHRAGRSSAGHLGAPGIDGTVRADPHRLRTVSPWWTAGSPTAGSSLTGPRLTRSGRRPLNRPAPKRAN